MDFFKKIHTNAYVGLVGFIASVALWTETSRVAAKAEDAAQFPRFVLVLIMLDCAYLMISAIRSKEVNEWKIAKPDMLRVGILIATLVLYTLFIGTLGYVISTIILLAVTLRCFLNENRPSVWIVAVVVPIALYFFFFRLGVRLPISPFGLF